MSITTITEYKLKMYKEDISKTKHPKYQDNQLDVMGLPKFNSSTLTEVKEAFLGFRDLILAMTECKRRSMATHKRPTVSENVINFYAEVNYDLRVKFEEDFSNNPTSYFTSRGSVNPHKGSGDNRSSGTSTRSGTPDGFGNLYLSKIVGVKGHSGGGYIPEEIYETVSQRSFAHRAWENSTSQEARDERDANDYTTEQHKECLSRIRLEGKVNGAAKAIAEEFNQPLSIIHNFTNASKVKSK